MRLFLSLIFILTSTGYSLQSQAPALKAGPMLGQLTHHSVKVWAWARPGDTIGIHLKNREAFSQADSEGIFRLQLENLKPETGYSYHLSLNGTSLPDTFSFTTLSHQPVFDFDMALGSCAYIVDSAVEGFSMGRVPFGDHYEMFDTIANRKPDYMFWLGDNIYLRDNEWESRDRVLYRYLHSRQHPSYAHLLATGSHIAIWDDHDFGPNDSDRTYAGKEMTRDVFLKQWLNPAPVTDSGIYSRWRIGDVELFLLDDRTFRPRFEDGSMFGEAQQAWLLEALQESDATFKIVATGSQLLSTFSLGESYWVKREAAFKAFMDSLAAIKVPGIMFVSGDVHVTEISRYDLEGGYPLYDFTFSPLTSLPTPVPIKNYRRVRKSYFRRRNFGWMAFRGEGEQRRMIVRATDRKGRTLWEHVIYAKALGW